MEASKEFKVGKHGIGWVDSDFLKRFGEREFEQVAIPPRATTLPRLMSDSEIASEFKPGNCTIGDVLAVMESGEEKYKDGNFNIFYFPECVVSVYWYAGDREWRVGTWGRDGYGWYAGRRVFSPASDRPQSSSASTLESSDPVALGGGGEKEDHVSHLRFAMYKVIEKNAEGLTAVEVIRALKKISEDMYGAHIDEALAAIPVEGLDAVADAWDLTWLSLLAVELREVQERKLTN